MEPEGRGTIDLPEDLEERIERRSRQTGFESAEEYVRFVLEQVLRATESQEISDDGSEPVDLEDVREMLNQLGYF